MPTSNKERYPRVGGAMDVGLCRHTHSRGRGDRKAALPKLTLQPHRPAEPMENHYCKQKRVLGFHLPAWAQGDHVTCGEKIPIILNPVRGVRAVQLLHCKSYQHQLLLWVKRSYNFSLLPDFCSIPASYANENRVIGTVTMSP